MRHRANEAALPGRLCGLILALSLVWAGCGAPRQVNGGHEGADRGTIVLRSLPLEAVDVLVVVDNSESMAWAQSRLPPHFIYGVLEALTTSLPSRPDLRIGVISTDLGTAPYATVAGCDAEGGDGGRLQHPLGRPPWLALSPMNQPNIHCPSYLDSRACLADAFHRQAALGVAGCGYEMPLEAAWRALDPSRNVNPGFLRDEALLFVLFVTDEDDCSVQRPELLNPAKSAEPELGPLTSFRCFAMGIRCGESSTDPFAAGFKEDCVPSGDYLRPIDDYAAAFASLKGGRPGRVLMGALAGPTSPVIVGRNEVLLPWLEPSCDSGGAKAKPALRLDALVRRFGGRVHSICADDYDAPSRHLGRRMAAAASQRCLPRLVMRDDGSPACGAVADADCRLWLRESKGARREEIPRCSPSVFSEGDNGCVGTGACPCWRLASRPQACGVELGVAPYGLDLVGIEAGPQAVLELACALADAGACR